MTSCAQVDSLVFKYLLGIFDVFCSEDSVTVILKNTRGPLGIHVVPDYRNDGRYLKTPNCLNCPLYSFLKLNVLL